MLARTGRVLATAVALVALTACENDSTGAAPQPEPTVTKTKTLDLSEHESGPESPIAYGLFVPAGATQLGPLFRYRSSRLIAAYRPELEAAEAQRAADQAEDVARDEANGTPSPSPTPTPTTRPSADSFKLIGDAPRPDTSVSLMRIDGDPTQVVREMLAQIDAAIPDAGLVLDDLSPYCAAQERRITSCRVVARGMTEGDREIRVTMNVDAGDLATRTAPPAALTHPVMQVIAEYVGDPRDGQTGRDTGSLNDIADVKDTQETSGLIWPKMDLDADLASPLLDGWTTPQPATLLLSGYTPSFAVMTTERAVDADQAAEQFVASKSPRGTFAKDVVEDLNSVSTMYAYQTKDGSIARAVYILSARGNYTALFLTPPSK